MTARPIDEQLTYIKKGLAELIREEELRERMTEAAKAGRPFIWPPSRPLSHLMRLTKPEKAALEPENVEQALGFVRCT